MESSNRRNAQLLAYLAGEAIVDLAMPRYRSLRAGRRVGEDRVTPAFSGKDASVTTQMVQQFVPFHRGALPA